MSKKDEALKRALENICAAKLCEINSMSSRHEMIRLMDAAITVLREALAEPMEWLTGCPECGMDGGCDCDSGTWNPPAQQEEKPTTREEILSMAREAGVFETRYNPVVYSATPEALELFAALVAAHVRETERKPWVGLTEDEINEVLGGDIRDEPSGELEFVRAIEAKLREKNA